MTKTASICINGSELGEIIFADIFTVILSNAFNILLMVAFMHAKMAFRGRGGFSFIYHIQNFHFLSSYQNLYSFKIKNILI